jgi:hypothetical protein
MCVCMCYQLGLCDEIVLYEIPITIWKNFENETRCSTLFYAIIPQINVDFLTMLKVALLRLLFVKGVGPWKFSLNLP